MTTSSRRKSGRYSRLLFFPCFFAGRGVRRRDQRRCRTGLLRRRKCERTVRRRDKLHAQGSRERRRKVWGDAKQATTAIRRHGRRRHSPREAWRPKAGGPKQEAPGGHAAGRRSRRRSRPAAVAASQNSRGTRPMTHVGGRNAAGPPDGGQRQDKLVRSDRFPRQRCGSLCDPASFSSGARILFPSLNIATI